MSQTRIEEFLSDVVSYIRFPFARGDIHDELEGHILDKMDYYISTGICEEDAEELAIRDMGDSKTIGQSLNKEHNPLIGWFLKISNAFIILYLFLSVFSLVINFSMSLFGGNLLKEVAKEDIVYRMDIDEKVKIDDRVIHFTNLIYDKEGNMNIFYKDYVLKPWGTGWTLGTIGTVSDDLGEEYMGYSGTSTGGYINKSLLTIRDFSEKADSLIIEYDLYNRYYKIEIPLKEGENK